MKTMKRFAAPVALLAFLGACSVPTTPSTTPAPTPAVNVGDAAATGVQLVAASCQALQPTVAAVPGAMSNASASAQAQATNILSYEASVCNSAAAINAVVAANPSGANQTATWITALGAGLTEALPAILQATSANKS